MDKGKGRATSASAAASAAAGPSTTAGAGGAGGAGIRDGIEDSELTYNETIDAIVQFLEAAFHTILYIRGVYPAEIFKMHRLYSHPVYRSRHPGLNEYLSTVLASIRSEVRASRVSQVLLVLKSATTGVFLERYVFRLSYLLEGAHAIPRADRDLSIRDNVTFRELSAIFRGFLMKLAVCEVGLEGVPDEEDLEFAIMVLAREGCRVGPQGEDPNQPDEGMWVPADDREGFFPGEEAKRNGDGDEEMNGSGSELRARRQTGRSGENGAEAEEGATILPIKSLDSGVINLMLYVEDNPTSKATLRRSARSRSQRPASTHTTPRRPPSQRHRNQRPGGEDIEVDPALSLQDSGDRDIEDLLQRDATGAPPGSRAGGGDADASRGTKRKGIARRSSQRTPRSKGKLKGKGKGKTRAPTLTHEDESDEDLSDSSASPISDDDDGAGGGSGSRSPSSDERSDASIVSVGDFAGYGGAGAGMGGGGMSAAW
ncbi:DNA-binding protein [Microstroma glucosiphilum]|uniref:DNA-binding protein n=1 Tax=Pseudomicrostroma glucosiphilum TaxID=1684307 RepID=A0A316U5A5_9BASI|nr:DNA-binding protein [Pseudomicrostroma glucosiphilum]PWN19503.1 DNA-binding protein [Pseudomicrostroma glucosiphilum]